jgi:hypothetical protein
MGVAAQSQEILGRRWETAGLASVHPAVFWMMIIGYLPSLPNACGKMSSKPIKNPQEPKI